jgi:hypothetical protein
LQVIPGGRTIPGVGVATGVGDVPGVGLLGWDGVDEPPQRESAAATAVARTRSAIFLKLTSDSFGLPEPLA